MKLAKALKQKNILAGEIARLKTVLAEQNSRSARQPFDYDTHAVLAQLRAKTDELVSLKARLAAANVDAYARIFRLAELKGLAASLKARPTKEGVYTESLGYAGRIRPDVALYDGGSRRCRRFSPALASRPGRQKNKGAASAASDSEKAATREDFLPTRDPIPEDYYHATRRQVSLYGQAKAAGRTHRGRL